MQIPICTVFLQGFTCKVHPFFTRPTVQLTNPKACNFLSSKHALNPSPAPEILNGLSPEHTDLCGSPKAAKAGPKAKPIRWGTPKYDFGGRRTVSEHYSNTILVQ